MARHELKEHGMDRALECARNLSSIKPSPVTTDWSDYGFQANGTQVVSRM